MASFHIPSHTGQVIFLPSFMDRIISPHILHITNQAGMLLARMASLQGWIASHNGGAFGLSAIFCCLYLSVFHDKYPSYKYEKIQQGNLLIASHTRGQSGYLQCFTAPGSELRLPPNDQTIWLQLSKGNWQFLRFIQTSQSTFQNSQLNLQIITVQKQSIIRTRSSELSTARSPVFNKETKLHEKKS